MIANKSNNVEISKYAISPDQAGTLAGLFKKRVDATPDKIAYRHYDIGSQAWISTTWLQMSHEIADWQQAMQKSGLQAGDRVGMMLKNCREWIVFDQAALGLGLVTVPLFSEDRVENIAYIAEHADIKLLLVENKRQWRALLNAENGLPSVKQMVSVISIEDEDMPDDPRLISLSDWIFGLEGSLQTADAKGDDLASIVYTSGTTGRPKGVMLSHRNMLSNAWSSLNSFPVMHDDLFLSFLPLSHTLERTVGYYLTMMAAAEVAFARAISLLAEDMLVVKPTILVSVPRIYERVYGRIYEELSHKPPMHKKLFESCVKLGWKKFLYEQKRGRWSPVFLLWPLLNKLVANKILSKLGGRLRVAICGGAPLPPDIGQVFISLGLSLLQGYGLTEASPVISVNRTWDNIPASIGLALPEIQVRIGENDELQTKSESVMMGYWANEEATRSVFTADGWLKTGDKAHIEESGHIYITGRLKDILVLGNGEKVPPADMEMAISLDPLFEQVMIVGEGRHFLTALIVLNESEWKAIAKDLQVDFDQSESLQSKKVKKYIQTRVSESIKSFPGYAQIRDVHLELNPWTVDGDLLTPTLKIKRPKILKRYEKEIDALYENVKGA